MDLSYIFHLIIIAVAKILVYFRLTRLKNYQIMSMKILLIVAFLEIFFPVKYGHRDWSGHSHIAQRELSVFTDTDRTQVCESLCSLKKKIFYRWVELNEQNWNLRSVTKVWYASLLGCISFRIHTCQEWSSIFLFFWRSICQYPRHYFASVTVPLIQWLSIWVSMHWVLFAEDLEKVEWYYIAFSSISVVPFIGKQINPICLKLLQLQSIFSTICLWRKKKLNYTHIS